MLTFRISPKSPIAREALAIEKLLQKRPELFGGSGEFVFDIDENGARLNPVNSDISAKSFEISLLRDDLLWRLNHSGRGSEAVCRAVMGKLDKPVVFDATAGLGRESMILQQAGCSVYMFERNPVIWLLLCSAIHTAKADEKKLSTLKNGLPELTAHGSIKDHYDSGNSLPIPDVIYYDPMFPQRTKSALVRKDMRIFHELIGFDEDTVEYANYLLGKASHHIVVKRPSGEPPLELVKRRSSFVDGKACRFDCYFCG